MNTGTAWFGTPTAIGQTYADPYYVAHDRTYASKQDAGPTQAYLVNDGDVPARPLLRVYGPVSHPHIYFGVSGVIWGSDDFQVDAAAHVTIDTDQHLCYRGDDPEDSVISWISFQDTIWPVMAPHAATWMYLQGADYSHVSQVQASWRNGFLS